jgi:hypothetical protein
MNAVHPELRMLAGKTVRVAICNWSAWESGVFLSRTNRGISSGSSNSARRSNLVEGGVEVNTERNAAGPGGVVAEEGAEGGFARVGRAGKHAAGTGGGVLKSRFTTALKNSVSVEVEDHGCFVVDVCAFDGAIDSEGAAVVGEYSRGFTGEMHLPPRRKLTPKHLRAATCEHDGYRLARAGLLQPELALFPKPPLRAHPPALNFTINPS